METSIAPSYDHLIVGNWEATPINNNDHKIKLWKRFIGDIILEHVQQEDLMKFVDNLMDSTSSTYLQ